MLKPINVTQVNTFQKENDELVQIFRSMNFFFMYMHWPWKHKSWKTSEILWPQRFASPGWQALLHLIARPSLTNCQLNQSKDKVSFFACTCRSSTMHFIFLHVYMYQYVWTLKACYQLFPCLLSKNHLCDDCKYESICTQVNNCMCQSYYCHIHYSIYV